MKRLHKIFLAFGFVGLLLLTSCDKNFDKINTNPDIPQEVPTPYLMTRMQRNLAYEFYGVWRGVRIPGLCSQHWSQRNYTEEDRYTFRSSNDDSMFRNIYIYMQNATSIIEINKTKKDAVQLSYGDYDMQIGTAMLIRAWGLQLATETFGDVPYTEALVYKTGDPMPKYDKQEDIFKFLERDIKAANALLLTAKSSGNNTAWNSPETGPKCDILFEGDIDKWLKFGNSLLLRLAIRQSEVNPNWKTLADYAISAPGGLMTSNADNATFYFTGAGSPIEAPIYNGFFASNRNDFTMSWQLANLMKGLNDDKIGFVNPLLGLKDPRFDVYIGKVNVDAGRFDGLPYGLPTSVNNKYVDDNNKIVIDLMDKGSNTSSIVLNEKFWSTFMDYPNVEFILAEINGSSANLENAIEASLEVWGITEDCTPYITSVVDKFNAANAEGKKEIILTQKYIHNFAHYSNEAWSEYRRTGYPLSLIKPGDVTAVIEGKTYTFTPLTSSLKTIATRMKYPISEFTSNEKNVSDAINNMGGYDNVNVPLWWMPKAK